MAVGDVLAERAEEVAVIYERQQGQCQQLATSLGLARTCKLHTSLILWGCLFNQLCAPSSTPLCSLSQSAGAPAQLVDWRAAV